MDQPTCHRRECDSPAAFIVREQYREETGQGTVEATAKLCFEHTDAESPTNLDDDFKDYRFEITPLSDSVE